MLDHLLDIVWDAFKAYVQVISIFAAVNKKQKANIQVLQTQTELQNEKYSLDPSIINFDIMMAAQRDLHMI